MAHEPTGYESESLAASLRAYLSETGFAFTGLPACLPATEATPAITRVSAPASPPAFAQPGPA
ncbi:hypothetical protein [Streptomyces sp. NPDC023588]|uniref:hypothetical protein n=1 Tax=Streptomyces sp. NPDC023588 TaxID=3154907 RepID=UPI0033F7E605